jgi:hypothetical protein
MKRDDRQRSGFAKKTVSGAFLVWLFFAAATVEADAQLSTFRWQTEVCEYSGSYDPRKYTLRQLQDTSRLMRMAGVPLNYGATVWNIEDIGKADLGELDREYREKREMLLGLDVVRTSFWENVRAAKLKELDQSYRLKWITARAYTNPAILMEYEGAGSCKTKFAEPIVAGGEALVEAWREVNKASQAQNADPARLQRQFDQENASPDRLRYALIETLSFGWWNCANALIEYEKGNSDGTNEKAFKRLFTRVRTVYCEGP